ncbi:pyroglutamyl-peptidase [Labedella gwakjiensis]|uniref:Pyroglutamyl-peptidase I n=1 Tax=Labedella gwakjiensis TaxID=390269 RepID=A0A2P8GZW5_9MICO|nr:pyroglutamyl-peptidase I [Labedella gwakjiensis]PSL39514.1 pyroglutamyl-peptidase [Labedella gwakjiensis]RUQ86087.1 pyroglutamyl-peptidase I [Labedella gwakjiensis]
MTRVLVTGFEPFGGSTVNASAEAVALLPDRIGDVDIVRATLPCLFDEAPRRLALLIHEVSPDLVVAVGEAGGRTSVDVERVAVNLDDARIPDNAGRQPIDRVIIDDAPVAYLSGLPVKACAAAIDEVGVASGVSNTAGTFVCNHVFFALMHMLEGQPERRGGFVHVPTLDRLSAAASATALAAVIRSAARTTEDIRVSRGAEF